MRIGMLTTDTEPNIYFYTDVKLSWQLMRMGQNSTKASETQASEKQMLTNKTAVVEQEEKSAFVLISLEAHEQLGFL